MQEGTQVSSSLPSVSNVFEHSELPTTLFDPENEPILRAPLWQREPRPALSTNANASTARKVWKRHEREIEAVPEVSTSSTSPMKAVKKIAFAGDDSPGKRRRHKGRRGKVLAVPVVSTPARSGMKRKLRTFGGKGWTNSGGR